MIKVSAHSVIYPGICSLIICFSLLVSSTPTAGHAQVTTTSLQTLTQLLNQFEQVPLTADGSVTELHIPNVPNNAMQPPLAAGVAVRADANDVWDDRFSPPGVTCCVGFSFDVRAVEVVGTDVYVAGEFREVGHTEGTSGIARWDGRRWHSLDGGLDRSTTTLAGQARDMAVSGDNIYVIGNFDRAGTVQANQIARWNITTETWHAVGNRTGPADGNSDGSFSTIAIVEGEVFVGGDFDSIDGVDAYRVASWNGSIWKPLAGGVANETLAGYEDVFAIAGSGNLVYVGGEFDYAVNPVGIADIEANNIAVWNRTTGRWSALGSGVSGPVGELLVVENTLYAGGSFERAGGQIVNNIARWNGSQWAGLAGGTSGSVYSFTQHNNQLYVTGFFYDAGNVANTENLARWDGSQWHSLRSDLLMSDPADDQFYAIGVLQTGNVFVAGDFNDSGLPLVSNIAYWDGTRWRGTGMGFEDGSTAYIGGDSNAVAVNDAGHVYVGGEFSEIGGLPYNRLAMWDGNDWYDIGGGINGDVGALLMRGDLLYVGGGFSQVGNGITAVRVAVYNMRTGEWAALGNGLPDGFVTALAFVGNTLYAGGSGFPSQTECCLWKWDGTNWAPFSERFRTEYFVGPFGARTGVSALGSDGEQLLVGGAFLDVELRATVERFDANDLFLYNPADDSISLFGTGADNGDTPAVVAAFAITSDAIYVGGRFKTIADAPTVNIARLTNAGWAPVGTGAIGDNAAVYTFATHGSDLYVGGRFETAGVEAFNIARWDMAAQHWSALGCGIARNGDSVSSGRVAELAIQPLGRPNAGLYVTGGIAEAGCLPSMGFAAWYGVGTYGIPNLNYRAFLPDVAR
jgi:trimeric autotransporter adhesin